MRWSVAPSTEEAALLMEAGVIYRDSKRFQEARDVFKGVRALFPQSDLPEIALGTVAFQEGDFEGAIKHYRRALEINPRSAHAHAHLGEVYLFKMDKDTARQHVKKALELDPRGEAGKMARETGQLTDVVEFKTE